MKQETLTHKNIGCAMKVQNTLGNGFQGVIFQGVFTIGMEKQGLGFQQEMKMSGFLYGNKYWYKAVCLFCIGSNNGATKSFDLLGRS